MCLKQLEHVTLLSLDNVGVSEVVKHCISQGEVEGSQKHQQLMTSARDYFLTTTLSAAGGPEIHRYTSIGLALSLTTLWA